jgi:exonuclease III
MDMRFGTWNVRSMYRAGSLKAVAEEISKCKLDLVGVQEVRWDGGSTEPAGEYTLFYGKGNENHELSTVSWYIRESYQQLKGQSLLVTGYHT